MDDILKPVSDFFKQASLDTVLNLAGTLLLYLVGWKIITKLMGVIEKRLLKSNMDKGVVSFLSSLISISLKVLLIVSVLINLGVPSASFVTLMGSAGIAIGLAMQGSLANLAGGLMILIYKPFKVGHFIECNGFTAGVVKEIGIFYTKLRTPDNRTVVMPNSTLSNGNVINMNENAIRRIDIPLSFYSSVDVEKVKRIMTDTALSNPDTLSEPAMEARLTTIDKGVFTFTLRVFTPQEKWWNARHDLNEALVSAFARENIPFAPPQLSVEKVGA